MTEPIEADDSKPRSLINTAIDVLVSPSEAFAAIKQRPTKLFPLALILLSTMAVMFWYFSIVDFDWYIDDVLAGADLDSDELEQAREQMTSMSQTTFAMFGILGAGLGLMVMYVLQAGYLSLSSALSGSGQKFGDWFSLVLWAGLPYLLSIVGMIANILLSPNGQLSAYTLDPLSFTNLGMQSSNDSLNALFNTLNLTMFWSLALTVLAYRQWTDSGTGKAMAIVLAPYLLIAGVWTYFAVT